MLVGSLSIPASGNDCSRTTVSPAGTVAQISGARWHPSPNFGPRRGHTDPSLIVLHYTGMTCADAALARMCDPLSEVSAHYMIDRAGVVVQMVRDEDRAWHAGAGAWQGMDDINSRSIGLELVNDGFQPFPLPQMRALEHVLRALVTRWSISAVNILAHADMTPERKEDPGPRFDWRALARQGLAFWPDGSGDGDQPFSDSLDGIGYPACAAEKRLQAFRFRYRPWGTGPECAADRARAAWVAQAFRSARLQS